MEAAGDIDMAYKLRDESLDMYRDITQTTVSTDRKSFEAVFEDIIAFWSR